MGEITQQSLLQLGTLRPFGRRGALILEYVPFDLVMARCRG
jgi:hypothetical protein